MMRIHEHDKNIHATFLLLSIILNFAHEDIHLSLIPLHSFEAVVCKTLWPEYEIIQEEESEYAVEMSEDNVRARSFVSRNQTDNTMTSLLEAFEVCIIIVVILSYGCYSEYFFLGVSRCLLKSLICLLYLQQGDSDRKSWASFEERIGMAPEQVLRYFCFLFLYMEYVNI